MLGGPQRPDWPEPGWTSYGLGAKYSCLPDLMWFYRNTAAPVWGTVWVGRFCTLLGPD